MVVVQTSDSGRAEDGRAEEGRGRAEAGRAELGRGGGRAEDGLDGDGCRDGADAGLVDLGHSFLWGWACWALAEEGRVADGGLGGVTRAAFADAGRAWV